MQMRTASMQCDAKIFFCCLLYKLGQWKKITNAIIYDVSGCIESYILYAEKIVYVEKKVDYL